MKKAFTIAMAIVMLMSNAISFGETTPPPIPDGEAMQGSPAEMPGGGNMNTPPEKPNGEMNNPMDMPSGDMGGMGNPMDMPGGMGGGMQSAPTEYAAVYTVTEDESFDGEMESTGTDENVIHVESGTASIEEASIQRESSDSTGGDASSFYGVGAAILATGGTTVIENSAISTDAAGGAGAFAYGDGVIYISDTAISTQQDTSGGIHVAGGGTLHARNLTVETNGESAAAIRSDRGGGTMTVDGGRYTSNGVASPAVYVTADISINNADLSATASEALCMEGLNTVRLFDCNLSGAMQDLSQNDNTWTVIVYQSMSGDSEIGKGRFEMSGGTLESANGGLFYTTNTESEFILSNVAITACEDSEYFLRVTGNTNQRGWGNVGSNGAECVFTGLNQLMEGNVIWDNISTLDMYIAESSHLIGAVVNEAAYEGSGYCKLYIDASSMWIVTGDSVLSELYCEGSIVDSEGRNVSVVSADGTVLLEGDSEFSVTVDAYSDVCDLSGMGVCSDWADYAVEF